ncbi:NblA/ycf18 family protein [Spirulina sp. 06S082]|jgi:hypothetical protein|uniref:NblA/ycf18 family protein n=1 Tax=Spirulina sp. 06S082 TaxID=3110248 RepID=UPI002B1EC13A|nr:NblA/ycf18 family protein [Spirulina sp. 06S082]MEA5467331.1 NblA/ycf18 family protein [Spirulina sp. 06S082]
MENPNNFLSLEQQFELRKFAQQAKCVSRDELENLFIEIIQQKMRQENLFKTMFKGA